MRILAIDTSCDETSAAVTENTTILANVIWSQASLHARWGGVVPSLAQREHKKRIDWVVEKAIKRAKCQEKTLSAIAVTIGPGLAIALEVGIQKAKELAKKTHLPLLTVNHLEGHLLSVFAQPKGLKNKPPEIDFPAFGLIISGGHTDFFLIKKIGQYQLLAKTQDDALGEALDKAARMLGLGYPGGAVLEKMAKNGKKGNPLLPLPLAGQEDKGFFSYSGLKTALWRLVEEKKARNRGFLEKDQIEDLAAHFQNRAFEHLIRVLEAQIQKNNQEGEIRNLLVGGGVSANNEVRKELRMLGKRHNLRVWFPYSKKLCGDNAAMIGIAAYFKAQRGEYAKNVKEVDRRPRFEI